ncbi:hypothetical protein JCM10213_003019 [Rhodosporidiobolus nylandii]
MSTKRTVTTSEDWSARLSAVNVSKDDLNLLVANYLFTEGYLSAAEHFSREAGLPADGSAASTSVGSGPGAAALGDVDSIRRRMDIKRAVLRGDVEDALEQVVDLDLEILDLDPSLHFHLLQQRLIELIRANNIPSALAFAQTELAPLAEEHPRFLKELERTMALLAFEMPTLSVPAPPAAQPAPPAAAPATAPPVVVESKKSSSSSKKGKSASSTSKDSSALPPMPSQISSLLDPSHRLSTATSLNAAILRAQGHPSEPKLPGLLGMMTWGEGLLRERNVEWPRWDLREVLQQNKDGKGEKEARVDGEGMAL